MTEAWDGDRYQRRFDELAAAGEDVHGEASFVCAFDPRTVLDAGCGSGRVAIELASRGIDVVGADVDASMLATARRLGPDITWVESDLATLDLGRTFDVVVLAGNVPLFTPPGTQDALVAGCARHVGGVLVAGFQLDRGYGVDDYDAHCAAAGLALVERFATWDRQPFQAGGDYAVSVHRQSTGAPRSGGASVRRAVVILAATMLGLASCGGDDDAAVAASSDQETTTSTGDSDASDAYSYPVSSTTTTSVASDGVSTTSVATTARPATTTAPAPTTTAAPAPTTTASPQTSSVSVTTRGFAFEPASLQARAGEITFNASNADAAAHTFTVNGTDVDIALPPNGSGSAAATLAAGSYDFVCRIHGSMTGTLTVS